MDERELRRELDRASREEATALLRANELREAGAAFAEINAATAEALRAHMRANDLQRRLKQPQSQY